MAAPGTVTHVLEVAKQLAAVVAAHAETVAETAAAAEPTPLQDSTPPPPT